MKKFLAYFTAIIFVGVISLSIMAFTNGGDPEKQKSETTATVQNDDSGTTATAAKECSKHTEVATAESCEQHAEATADAAASKPCCKHAAETASADGEKAAECKQKGEVIADAK